MLKLLGTPKSNNPLFIEDKDMKKCPSCSTDNSDDTKFCRNCGWQLSVLPAQSFSAAANYPKVLCPKCGTLNISTIKFCSSCRQPLTQEAADQLARERNPASAKKTNGCLKVFLITALACVVIFVILPLMVTSISSYLEKAKEAEALVSSHNSALATKTTIAANSNEAAVSEYLKKAEEAAAQISIHNSEVEAGATLAQETKESYIASCVSVSYSDLCRNPNDYIGKRISVTGEISTYSSGSLITADGFTLFEDYDISGDSYYSNSWLIDFTQPEENRILEKDVVTFYGEFKGLVDLTFGMDEPELTAVYFDFVSQTGS